MSFSGKPANEPKPLRFLAIEGVDGCGKTTQAALIADWYRGQGREVVLTREPGGTPLGERLRTIIKDASIPCTPRAELMLLLAARAQHVDEVIRPAIKRGALVISDRFCLSTMAYQAGGRELSVPAVASANKTATGNLLPDCTVLLKVPLAAAMARIGARDDRFEGEGQAFLERVLLVYNALPEWDTSITVVDGTGSIEQVQQAIRDALVSRFPAG